MRYNKDGSVSFPVKGKPPLCPEGFMPDSGDAYRFLPIIKECPHRRVVYEELPCKCGFKNTMRCNLLGLPVGVAGCHKCQTNENWLKDMLNDTKGSTSSEERNDVASEANEVPSRIHG